jgi:hypothetical protein
MSFIRCLQQSGNANVAAHTSLVMVNTPVRSEAEYAILKQIQRKLGRKAPFVYRTSMQPEYQNIAKNILGRTFIGKSYVENADGSKEADPPELEAVITNPFICAKNVPGVPAKVRKAASAMKSGGVIFAAYCMLDPCILRYGFADRELLSLIRDERLDLNDFSQIHSRLDYFCLDRKEQIDALRTGLGVTQLHFVAAEGYAKHMDAALADMDEETYRLFLRYHLATCERADMVGISHHTIDIFRKD